jgi:hypothetical protein
METLQIPASQIADILFSMHWVISPYYDADPFFADHPHIKELAENYNRLLNLFSQAYNHTLKPF